MLGHTSQASGGDGLPSSMFLPLHASGAAIAYRKLPLAVLGVFLRSLSLISSLTTLFSPSQPRKTPRRPFLRSRFETEALLQPSPREFPVDWHWRSLRSGFMGQSSSGASFNGRTCTPCSLWYGKLLPNRTARSHGLTRIHGSQLCSMPMNVGEFFSTALSRDKGNGSWRCSHSRQ